MKKLVLPLVIILVFVALVRYASVSHATRCETLEGEAKAALQTAEQCTADSDCTLQPLRCPFPCMNAMNRGQVSAVLDLVEAYQKECMYVCPDCPKEFPSGVRCVSGRCRPLS